MKKLIKINCLLVIMLLLVSSAQAQSPITVRMTKGQAKITALQGKADVICDGKKTVRSLQKNDYLQAGCEVSTAANSRLEMRLPDQSIVRFSEKTKFRIVQADIDKQGRRAVGISLAMGKVWTNVRKSLMDGGRDKFEISCQNAVAGVRGTVYRMDVEDDQSALVKVYDGEVNVSGVAPKQDSAAPLSVGPPRPIAGPTAIEGPKPVSMEQWVYIVKSMQQVRISSDGRAEEPKDFTEAEDMDDWVKWNKDRDEKSGK